MTLIATPGSETANAYLTLEEANAYMDERLGTDAWTSADDSTRERAIIMAARLLDSMFKWNGYPSYYDVPRQALGWPRYGAYDEENREYDNFVIPTILKRATADLAFELLARDRTSDPELVGLGFSKVDVGPISVTIDAKMVIDLIPQYVLNSLSRLGESTATSTGGMRTVRLLRT